MSENEQERLTALDMLRDYAAKYNAWLGSDEFREASEDRRNKTSQYEQLLSQDSISAMTEVELHELISSLWAFGGWGNKDYLVDRLLRAVHLDEFKGLLKDLLWGPDPLGKRYDKFNESVKYLGSAAISEILAFVHPSDCMIWNERTRTGLKAIGFLRDFVDHYWIDGDDYEKICGECIGIISLLNELDIHASNLLDVDLFLYQVSIMEELEEEEEEQPITYDFDHNEIKERIFEVGQYLGFEAEKEVRIARGAQVDSVWTVHLGNLGVVKYVFEVHKGGSLDSTILNLQRARRNPAVQKGIIVSNTDGLQHARSEVETLGEDFSSFIAYLEAADVLKMAKSLREVWQIINGLELIKSI